MASSSTNIREEYELNKERRTRYLANLIKEAVYNVIAEQQMPAPAPVAADPMAAAQPAPMPTAADPNAPMDPMANPEAPGAGQEEFTLDKMIEKLNVIRGGRSFTDPEIYGQLTTMFKSWDEPTKQTISKTFDNIAKVVTLNAEGQPGANPDQTGTATTPQPAPQTPAPAGQAPAGGGMAVPPAPTM